MKANTFFSVQDQKYKTQHEVGQVELFSYLNSKQFLQDTAYLMAKTLAGKIIEQLAPAIDKAFAEMKLEIKEEP